MGQYFDNEKLPSKMVKTSAVILGKKFTFFTDNGVFSKDGLDFGSRLLLETIPLEEVGGKVLDMGCGTIMSNINTVAVATLVDVSCILLAEDVMPDEELINVATAKGVNIISTPLSAYKAAIKLSELIN